MKVCFPITVAEGLQSRLYGHFSSAPFFIVVDNQSLDFEIIENCDPKNPLNGNNPFAALQGKTLDAIVVEGISDAALQTMNMCGFRVYATATGNLEQTMKQLEGHQLQELEPFYSQYEGRCGDETSEDDGCNHHSHEEDEAPEESCVQNGGSGCASHSDTCTHH